MITRIIKASSNAGDVVFDPFMGSGTTAVVALHLGRSIVGFEINADYCKILADRVDTFLTLSKVEQAEQLRLPL